MVLGLVAVWFGASALYRVGSSEYSIWAGSTIAPQSKFPTFDFVIHFLGHSLFPWSAFIPFAAGRLFHMEPSAGDEADGREARAGAARLLVLVGSAVAFGAYSVVAPSPFATSSAVPLLRTPSASALRSSPRSFSAIT
jgi:hypothetical protein